MNILNSQQVAFRFSEIKLPRRQRQGLITWRLWCKSLHGIPVADHIQRLTWIDMPPLFLEWLITKCLTWSLSMYLFCWGKVFPQSSQTWWGEKLEYQEELFEFSWDCQQLSHSNHRAGKHCWWLQSQPDPSRSQMLLLLGDGQENVSGWVKLLLIICALLWLFTML